MQFSRLSILGVGLLGGSIGLAVKSIVSNCKIIGYGHRQTTLDTALSIGAIDEGCDDLASAVRDADLVILCTPVGLFDSLTAELVPHLKPGAVVTDVGSTKRSIVRSAERLMPPHAHFVASHPIAGSEKRGVEFASADLFQQALCITTPTPRTNPGALEQVEAFWRELGMRLIRLSPEEHDHTLAEVSHLPHALAAIMVHLPTDPAMKLVGKGFLDLTRIAGGDGGLWRDIFLDNRDNLVAGLELAQKQIVRLQEMLERGDGDALRKWLDQAASRRGVLMNQKPR